MSDSFERRIERKRARMKIDHALQEGLPLDTVYQEVIEPIMKKDPELASLLLGYVAISFGNLGSDPEAAA